MATILSRHQCVMVNPMIGNIREVWTHIFTPGWRSVDNDILDFNASVCRLNDNYKSKRTPILGRYWDVRELYHWGTDHCKNRHKWCYGGTEVSSTKKTGERNWPRTSLEWVVHNIFRVMFFKSKPNCHNIFSLLSKRQRTFKIFKPLAKYHKFNIQ